MRIYGLKRSVTLRRSTQDHAPAAIPRFRTSSEKSCCHLADLSTRRHALLWNRASVMTLARSAYMRMSVQRNPPQHFRPKPIPLDVISASQAASTLLRILKVGGSCPPTLPQLSHRREPTP